MTTPAKEMKRKPPRWRPMMKRSLAALVLFGLVFGCLVFFAGCQGKTLDQIFLMPAPEVYSEGGIEPFDPGGPEQKLTYPGMLYATDREPDPDGNSPYSKQRGGVLRAGLAQIQLGDNPISWEEARHISLLKNRPQDYPLKVTGVEELGVLMDSLSEFTQNLADQSDPGGPQRELAGMINRKLQVSGNKDIYIYVHGYKVVFENPILVATELWHFLGYDGVFLAFAWPSTPKLVAYASDVETTDISAIHLRVLLQFLAKDTQARRIHILGYSAGTRVVIKALAQLALAQCEGPGQSMAQNLRLGHVVLVGSDFDRELFGAYLTMGLMDLPESLSVYLSGTDKALNFSRWLFGRDRLGQMWTRLPLAPEVEDYLDSHPKLELINVTGAEKAATGNGHAYFRKSPWVSSDILTTFLHDLGPAERGLVPMPDAPVWMFPADYVDRLKEAVSRNITVPE